MDGKESGADLFVLLPFKLCADSLSTDSGVILYTSIFLVKFTSAKKLIFYILPSKYFPTMC